VRVVQLRQRLSLCLVRELQLCVQWSDATSHHDDTNLLSRRGEIALRSSMRRLDRLQLAQRAPMLCLRVGETLARLTRSRHMCVGVLLCARQLSLCRRQLLLALRRLALRSRQIGVRLAKLVLHIAQFLLSVSQLKRTNNHKSPHTLNHTCCCAARNDCDNSSTRARGLSSPARASSRCCSRRFTRARASSRSAAISASCRSISLCCSAASSPWRCSRTYVSAHTNPAATYAIDERPAIKLGLLVVLHRLAQSLHLSKDRISRSVPGAHRCNLF
jgi:hypothetical protein